MFHAIQKSVIMMFPIIHSTNYGTPTVHSENVIL